MRRYNIELMMQLLKRLGDDQMIYHGMDGVLACGLMCAFVPRG